MLKNTLITSDLHLTDSPLDEYKWLIFDWLRDAVERHNIEKVIILGDITEKKDKHSSALVNRIAENFTRLGTMAEVIVLMGNHDYIDPDKPFFQFIKNSDFITFIKTPGRLGDILWLPHSHNPVPLWLDIPFIEQDIQECSHIFLHQTVTGVKVGNGMEMTGHIGLDFFKDTPARIFSGDIHIPQEHGDITYVGSPYVNYFGDDYEPRVIHYDGKGKAGSILLDQAPFANLRKWSITFKNLDELDGFGEYEMQPGDMAKIKVCLTPSEFHEWEKIRKEIREYCIELDVTLCSIELVPVKPLTRMRLKDHSDPHAKPRNQTPSDTLKDYNKTEKFGEDLLTTGLEIIDEVI
ncbi:MAG: metallophosphoesterase [Deltaproteobacteria bacterium]|nr:metallophosphoesterase [Deltaproteobacteria bacterium]